MRKIFSYFTILTLIALFSCEKEEDKVVISANVTAPVINNPSAGSAKTATEETLSEPFSINWERAEYGVSSPVTYVIQVDSANKGFLTPMTLATTTADSVRMTLGDFNTNLLEKLKIPANVPSVLDIRIYASLNNHDTVFSQTVKLTFTPWKKVVPPDAEPLRLWVPGAYQGWKPNLAPVISLVAEDLYEGYVYMSMADKFKFTSSPDWDHINYGYAAAGKLTTDGLADGLLVTAPGFYKFNVNVNALIYSATLIESWGLIGTATAGSWDNSTPMTYDQTNNVWKVTTDLVAGALKFRANNGWDINYGPANSNNLEGILIQTDAAISIPENGNYTVTIDFSKSKAPYKYTYTVKKN